MKTLFEEYLKEKQKNGESVKVYLKATQSIPDRYSKEIKTNNLMLSGKVADVDANNLLLEDQECLIPYSSILDIKPDRG